MNKVTSHIEALNVSAMALEDVLYDGTFDSHHRDIRDTLLDPIFNHHAGLSLQEAGRLAYMRARHVHGKLEAPLDILGNLNRLFALAEWPSVMDVSVFSLLMVHYNLCLGTLYDHGQDRPDLTEEFDDLNSLKAFGPYMATELGYGNNVAALRTEARFDPEGDCFVLNTPDDAAQKYMSYSGFNDMPKVAVVLARMISQDRDWGVFPFVVRISDENGLLDGVSAVLCPEKPVQGLDNGLTRFSNMRIPRKNLLLGDMGTFEPDGTFSPNIVNPRKRFLRAMSRIVPGRLCVSSAATGAGKASIYLALKFAHQRLTNAPGQNDMPIIQYRTHQRDTIGSLARVYGMVFLLNHGKREFTESGGEASPELNDVISIIKGLSTWEMTDVIATCRERCGAQGIFSANRIADYGSLLQGLVTAEGDNQVLLATTAGQIMMRNRTAERPTLPAVKGDALSDLAALDQLLTYREAEMLCDALDKMDGCADESFFDSLNRSMPTGLEYAKSIGVRLAYSGYLRAIKNCEEVRAKEALEMLARLYALNEIKTHSGWYLAKGALTAEQVLALEAETDALCKALVPESELLIEGFGLSPELLRAPICQPDYMQAFIAQAKCEVAGAPAPRGIEALLPATGKHVYACPLRWSDMDVYGVVNNVVFLRLLEQARVDFIWRLGPAGGDAFFADGSVVADHQIRYIRPVVYSHTPVRIETHVSKLTHASVTLKANVMNNSEICATAETTMAPYDYTAGCPRRLTQAEHSFFAGYMYEDSSEA